MKKKPLYLLNVECRICYFMLFFLFFGHYIQYSCIFRIIRIYSFFYGFWLRDQNMTDRAYVDIDRMYFVIFSFPCSPSPLPPFPSLFLGERLINTKYMSRHNHIIFFQLLRKQKSEIWIFILKTEKIWSELVNIRINA